MKRFFILLVLVVAGQVLSDVSLFSEITDLKTSVARLQSQNKQLWSLQEYHLHEIWRLQEYTKVPNANRGYPNPDRD